MPGIQQLRGDDGTWENLRRQWERQCEEFNEDFTEYAVGQFAIVQEIVDDPTPKAMVFGFAEDDECTNFLSFCQINTAGLPKYPSPVMRIRHMTLAPVFDFGDHDLEVYAGALVTTLAGILALSTVHDSLKANYVNFHLRSPADRNFFAAVGRGMNDHDMFASVQTVGSWLYIKKS